MLVVLTETYCNKVNINIASLSQDYNVYNFSRAGLTHRIIISCMAQEYNFLLVCENWNVKLEEWNYP